MHANVEGNNNFIWPMTADDILQEIRKPESPLRKLLNAVENEAALEKAFIDMVLFKEIRNQQQLEALLTEMIAEARAVNKEKFPDIIATSLFVYDTQHHKKILNEPTATQKEILQEQLVKLDEHIKDLKVAEKYAINAYHEARKSLIDAMVKKAEQTPLLRPDGKKVDVRKILEKIPPAEKPFQKYLDSVLEKIEKPSKEAGEFFLTEVLAAPPENQSTKKDFINRAVERMSIMEEMQLQFDPIRQYMDPSSENRHVDVEISASATMILDIIKKNKRSLSVIMDADRNPHDEALGSVFSTRTEIAATTLLRNKIKHGIDHPNENENENKNNYTSPGFGRSG